MGEKKTFKETFMETKVGEFWEKHGDDIKIGAAVIGTTALGLGLGVLIEEKRYDHKVGSRAGGGAIWDDDKKRIGIAIRAFDDHGRERKQLRVAMEFDRPEYALEMAKDLRDAVHRQHPEVDISEF